jgi:hypothetical protein
MHLSRHRKVVFFADHILRPGDGKRWGGRAIALLLPPTLRTFFIPDHCNPIATR